MRWLPRFETRRVWPRVAAFSRKSLNETDAIGPVAGVDPAPSRRMFADRRFITQSSTTPASIDCVGKLFGAREPAAIRSRADEIGVAELADRTRAILFTA